MKNLISHINNATPLGSCLCLKNLCKGSKIMSKMIVYICVVWIAGSRHDGGITKCMWHESQVKYQTVAECEDDIKHSKVTYLELDKSLGIDQSLYLFSLVVLWSRKMKHKDMLSKRTPHPVNGRRA